VIIKKEPQITKGKDLPGGEKKLGACGGHHSPQSLGRRASNFLGGSRKGEEKKNDRQAREDLKRKNVSCGLGGGVTPCHDGGVKPFLGGGGVPENGLMHFDLTKMLFDKLAKGIFLQARVWRIHRDKRKKGK